MVDDDPTVSEVVATYLDRAGFTVDRAADGPFAVAQAAAIRPDLVVLDLMLPGLDGFEVCRRIRQEQGVPVVRRLRRHPAGGTAPGLRYRLARPSPSRCEGRCRPAVRSAPQRRRRELRHPVHEPDLRFPAQIVPEPPR
ncbi:response regulator [Actinacidiphila oryziradicis]|uniref:Response regulator n=1 Tax=Actinacidiphila oryziradicis TaxID=2571141 RepID=A0A4V5N0P9_9ACTN|nr:response regulator [Actinacidiphila oryziradicis]